MGCCHDLVSEPPLANSKILEIRSQVMLSFFTDFENFSIFKPAATHEKPVSAMLDQAIARGDALNTLQKKW